MYYPIITVILVAEKQISFLEEALDSILMQSYPHWEVVVINISSMPAMTAKIKQYTARETRITQYIREEKHLGKALCFGVEHAHGEWISFLHEEDSYVQDRFSTLIENTFASPKSNIFHTAYLTKNEIEHTIRAITFPKEFTSSISPLSFMRIDATLPSSFFIHRTVLHSIPFSKITAQHAYIFALLLEASRVSQISFIDTITCYHRTEDAPEYTVTPHTVQFDKAKASIELLQKYSIKELLPSFKERTLEEYKTILAFMLETVLFQESIIYGCGTHTLYVERIIEWVANTIPQEMQADLIQYASSIILPELPSLPNILQESCSILLNLREREIHYVPEEISIILARAGGELLRSNPSIAMLYMNYYQKLFPEIYGNMLAYFNDTQMQTIMQHRKQNIQHNKVSAIQQKTLERYTQQ